MKHVDENGFTINEGHEQIDWSFLKNNRPAGRLDNAFEDAAYSISPDIKSAMKNNDVENFESLCDGAQG